MNDKYILFAIGLFWLLIGLIPIYVSGYTILTLTVFTFMSLAGLLCFITGSLLNE